MNNINTLSKAMISNSNANLDKSRSKAIIFDASTLISLSLNGLIEELKELKKLFNGKFLITNEVKRELIDNPMTIKKFELEALRIKELIEQKIIELPESIEINKEEISKRTQEFMDFANTMFASKKEEIKIIHLGEASSLALSNILNERGIKNVLSIDERTARMLVEKPENLKSLLEKKLHTKIFFKKDNFNQFKGFKVIRSAELIYFAYKKDIVKVKDGNLVLDALLYALKYKGCAISFEEIEEIKRLK
jgi:hypothetical protein